MLVKHGINATSNQLDKTLAWLDMVSQWGNAYNLTGIKDTVERINKFVLDSLATQSFLQGKEVLDVGSGAGVPGIPLAIFSPEKRYTLIDSSTKKALFLARCVRHLKLAGVKVIHTRMEQIDLRDYDTILARGVGSASHLIKLNRQKEKGDALWIIFKAARLPREKPPNDWHAEYIDKPFQRSSLALMLLSKAPAS